jgi:hypothetical protein
MEQPDAARFEPILQNKVVVAQNVLDELSQCVDGALQRLSGSHSPIS